MDRQKGRLEIFSKPYSGVAYEGSFTSINLAEIEDRALAKYMRENKKSLKECLASIPNRGLGMVYSEISTQLFKQAVYISSVPEGRACDIMREYRNSEID